MVVFGEMCYHGESFQYYFNHIGVRNIKECK